MTARSELVASLDARMPSELYAVVRIVLALAALLRTFTLWPGLLAGEVQDLGNSAYGLVLSGDPSASLPLPPAGSAWFQVMLIVWVLAASCMLVGRWSRTSCAGVGLLAVWLPLATNSHRFNHLFVLGLFSLLLSAAAPGAAYSVDTQRGRAAASSPWWVGWCIRFQMSVIYLSAALTKLNEDFLSGGATYWALSRSALEAQTLLPQGPVFWIGLSVTVIALEGLIGLLLWVRRARVVVAGMFALLHPPFLLLASHPQQLSRLTVFTLTMVGGILFILPTQPVELRFDPRCASCAWFVGLADRLDLLRVLRIVPGTGPLQLRDDRGGTSGTLARLRVLDASPLTFLPAALLRLVPAGVRTRVLLAADCSCGTGADATTAGPATVSLSERPAR
jgi:hypothetical protein